MSPFTSSVSAYSLPRASLSPLSPHPFESPSSDGETVDQDEVTEAELPRWQNLPIPMSPGLGNVSSLIFHFFFFFLNSSDFPPSTSGVFSTSFLSPWQLQNRTMKTVGRGCGAGVLGSHRLDAPLNFCKPLFPYS